MLSVGCSTFRKDSGSDFIKQLDAPVRAFPFAGRKPSERDLCIETARTVAAEGHADEAIRLYEKAESLDPNGKPFDQPLASLYAQTGDTESAIERYRRVIGGEQADAEVFNNFAWTLMESGRFDEAIQVAQQGLVVSPENQRLQATVAIILYKQGNRAQSLQAFQKLHGPSAAHHNVAILDLEHGNQEAALQHLNMATQQAGCSAQTLAMKRAVESEIARK